MSNNQPERLAVEDYVVFGITLAVSAAIGIFFAVKDRKSQAGTDQYLLGGRSLRMVPVALSLAVSFMSAITVLGAPAEVYIYGTMYWWFLLAMFIVVVITAEVFIPMFYNLEISSTYEYLEKRFNQPVRMLATIIYILENIFYIGIVIYAPSLALNAVTGFNLWAAILSTGLVCIFYTTLGGIKAVIWTDVFQAVVMVTGFLAVLIQGSIQLGGFAEAWRIANEGNRIDFIHFDVDPRVRHSFWSVVVGGTFLWLGVYAVSQSQVQRYISCKTEKEAKGSVYLNWLGLVVIISLSMMNGVLIYAYFVGCDPLSTGEIMASDQLLPLLTLKLFKDMPGLPGVVISGVFSGSLSTVSSGINAMACVTIEDFVKPFTTLTEEKYTWLTKGLVVIFGLLCVGMAYVASVLGGVLEAALSILGLVGGPLLCLFTLGLMFPFVNSWGAGSGLLSGLAFSIWVYVGSSVYPPLPEFTRTLSLSTDQCTVIDQNFTTIPIAATDMTPIATTDSTLNYPPISNLYAVSYSYYSCLGFAGTFVVGIVVSLLTYGWRQRLQVDPKLIHFFFDHWLFSWLPENFRSIMRCGLIPPDKNEKPSNWETTEMKEQHEFEEKYTPMKEALKNGGPVSDPTFKTFINGGFADSDTELKTSL